MHFLPTLVFLALGAVSPVRGHIGAYCQGCFGGARADLDAQLSLPLNAQSGPQSQWFFRGLTPNSATGTTSLTPGSPLTLNLACSKHNSQDGSGQSCNGDPSADHRRPDGSTSGCGLAISYKDFSTIQPSDFRVISTLHNCVELNNMHTFQIPSNLPAGKATLAFLWIPPPQSSADEMYMTGINVQVGGSNSGTVLNAPPAKYWGVSGFGANGQRPQYQDLPDGAQVFSTGGSSASAGSSSKANSSENASSGSENGSSGSSSGYSADSGAKGGYSFGDAPIQGASPPASASSNAGSSSGSSPAPAAAPVASPSPASSGGGNLPSSPAPAHSPAAPVAASRQGLQPAHARIQAQAAIAAAPVVSHQTSPNAKAGTSAPRTGLTAHAHAGAHKSKSHKSTVEHAKAAGRRRKGHGKGRKHHHLGPQRIEAMRQAAMHHRD